MPHLPDKLPEAWSIVQSSDSSLVLQKRLERVPLLLTLTALMVLIDSTLLAAYLRPGHNTSVLNHRLWLETAGGAFTLLSSYLCWLSCWALWGRETWHFQRDQVCLLRSFGGYSWIRQFQRGIWEITRSAGSGAETQHQLIIIEAHRRFAFAHDRYDDIVRGFGIALAEVTGWPLQTR